MAAEQPEDEEIASLPGDPAVGTPSPIASEILVVDDDPGNLIAIEAALGDLAAQVVRARSGTEALRYLLDHDCALILLDVQMPSMDGYETARLIRQRRRSRHTPIIFVTAHSRDDREVLDAYRFGAVDFLFKPVSPKVLRAKASVFVDLQRRTAEVAQQAERLRAHEERLHAQLLNEERRRWEGEELRRSNAEMAAAARRKDEFLAMLGHELRNPLAPIVTGLEVLRRAMPGGRPDASDGEPDRHELVTRTHETIDRQVRHLSRLVDDLLDMSRINSGKIELRREVVDLRELVAQAAAAAGPVLSEREHQLEQSIHAAPLWILADAVRIVQAISNLLNNAARYTDPCGRIQLVCEQQEDWAELRVSDNGRGISPDLLPHIFDMFVQERTGSDGGMGLGLTLVKRLVSLHGGTVAASSGLPGARQERRVGSVFTIRLPLTGPPPLAPPATKSIAIDRLLRVALVEDNPDIRGTLEDLLTDLGHEVKAAAEGEAGVALIIAMRPDVALVDIGLPKLDGYQVAEAIRRAMGAEVRLVAMSGFGQAADKERALRAGFDAHLVKPAAIDTLLAALAGKYPSPVT